MWFETKITCIQQTHKHANKKNFFFHSPQMLSLIFLFSVICIIWCIESNFACIRCMCIVHLNLQIKYNDSIKKKYLYTYHMVIIFYYMTILKKIRYTNNKVDKNENDKMNERIIDDDDDDDNWLHCVQIIKIDVWWQTFDNGLWWEHFFLYFIFSKEIKSFIKIIWTHSNRTKRNKTKQNK